MISAQSCFQRVILVPRLVVGARADHASSFSPWVCTVYFSPLPFRFSLYQTLPHLHAFFARHEILNQLMKNTGTTMSNVYQSVCSVEWMKVCAYLYRLLHLIGFTLFSCLLHTPFPKFTFSGGWQTLVHFLWTISSRWVLGLHFIIVPQELKSLRDLLPRPSLFIP